VITLPVIVNPVAGGGRVRLPFERLARVAAEHKLRLEPWPTEAPRHARELAERAARDRLPALAVWGGDGTYNEAAHGLLGSATTLLALPGGTTSVLAYELGIPRDPVKALSSQLDGESKAMTVGRTDTGRIFLLMLSAGPDSLILEHVPARLKLRGGKAGIAAQAMVEFMRGKLPRFEVVMNGERRTVSWCIAGNARRYGGPYLATPGADPFTPGFEVVLLTRHGRRATAPFFFAIPFGRHLRLRGVTHGPAHHVALQGEGVPYQLDGDAAGFLPVTARTVEERVQVRLPRRSRRDATGARTP
jgi:diacylglycerol kinase family enzyme